MPCQSCNLPQDQTALRGGGGEDKKEGIRGTVRLLERFLESEPAGRRDKRVLETDREE